MKRSAQAFAVYEYKESTVERRRVSEYLDGYESFGWELNDAYERPAAHPGAPGAIFCLQAYPIYRCVYRKRERAVDPLLDAKYEEISSICEKGQRLTRA